MLIMLRQEFKDIYYLFARWLAFPNYIFAKARYRRAVGIRIHLGCGETYISKMINIDGNFWRKKELWLDLRNGLPFQKESVLLVCCSHTIEHLYPNEAISVLSEIRRVLQPGGVARMAVPSIEFALKIIAGKSESKWPLNFETPNAQAINYLFCDGQHKYGYSSEVLSSFASKAGFKDIRDISEPDGVKRKDYSGVELGGEPTGSLVFELRV